ncbi:Transposase-associated domain [Sesbania bispinosa]|nr:Transposase-associated domain [Sesbania bispinosa]
MVPQKWKCLKIESGWILDWILVRISPKNLLMEFVKFACEQDENDIGRGKIRCPCKKCKCMKYEEPDIGKVHLRMKRFLSNYYHWTNHGEPIPPSPLVVVGHPYYGSNGQRGMFDNYERLVMDTVRP